MGGSWRIVASLWKISLEMVGTAVQVGMCWSDTCHPSARTSNTLKGQKIHSTPKDQKGSKMSIFPEKATEWRSAEPHWTTSDPSSSLLPLHPKILYLQQLLQVASRWPLTSPNHLSPHPSKQEAELTWIELILSYQKKKQGCEGQLGTTMVSGEKEKASPMSPSGGN